MSAYLPTPTNLFALGMKNQPTKIDQVGGFDGVPAAGEVFTVVGREDTARDLAEARRKIARESDAAILQAGFAAVFARILSRNMWYAFLWLIELLVAAVLLRVRAWRDRGRGGVWRLRGCATWYTRVW